MRYQCEHPKTYSIFVDSGLKIIDGKLTWLVFDDASRNLSVYMKGFNLQKCQNLKQQNLHVPSSSFCVIFSIMYYEQKKERECMLLRIAMMRNELQRQRKALSREIDLRQKERTQLQRKGKSSIHTEF